MTPPFCKHQSQITMNDNRDNRSITERVTVAGGELVETVKRLVAEGNVRRLIIRKPSGDPVMDIPLTAGVAVGGLVTALAPFIVALGAIAALVAKVEIDIERPEPRQIEDQHDPR
jgi:hypothetical protein